MQNISLLFIENMIKLIYMSTEKGLHDGHRQRMYKRVLSYPDSLTDVELLEVLLFESLKRVNTNELAHRLIRTFGSLEKVLNADKNALLTVKGIGERTAAFLVVTGTILRHSKKEKKYGNKIYQSFKDYKDIIVHEFAELDEEVAKLYLVNSKYIIKHVIDWTEYKNDKVDINTQEMSTILLANKPHGVVLAHNHLSGNCKPSLSDDEATKKLLMFLDLHGIKLMDHIIVSGNKTYSYYQENTLPTIKKEGEKLWQKSELDLHQAQQDIFI